jgi:hypothetical protein
VRCGQDRLPPRRGDDREDDFQLGRPAEKILVTDVIACLREKRAPMRGEDAVTRPVESLLAALNEGEAKSAAALATSPQSSCRHG